MRIEADSLQEKQPKEDKDHLFGLGGEGNIGISILIADGLGPLLRKIAEKVTESPEEIQVVVLHHLARHIEISEIGKEVALVVKRKREK